MHYLISAQVKNGSCLLPNYACCALEAYQRGVPLTEFILVKMANKFINVLEGVNALSHECIDGEGRYAT